MHDSRIVSTVPMQDAVLARPRMRFPTADVQFPLLAAGKDNAGADGGVTALKSALRRSSPFDSVTSNDCRSFDGPRRFSMEDAAAPLCVHVILFTACQSACMPGRNIKEDMQH